MNESQMLKGLLEGCVLKIIGKGECYSAELVEKLREYGFENVSEGTLFPLLLRLEARELFDTKKKANPETARTVIKRKIIPETVETSMLSLLLDHILRR